MTKTVVTLADRYEQREGQIFLSSMQAMVRLPVDRARIDRAAGLRTGGYVTGYRGSPITTLDAQLWGAKKLLAEHDVHFEPGLNEELAATSLRGTQQIEWFGSSPYDGVFAMWYAKGLGVDRAGEALKIANFEGTHARGGVLVQAGDDPAAKSSATAHQSEHQLIAAFLPILAPATTDEILRFGQLAWEMSRFSGLYVSMKTITDALDLTSSVILPDYRVVHPELSGANLNIRRGLTANQQESLVVNDRLPAAVAFARANALNSVDIAGGEHPGLTILTAGKTWLDVRQTLRDLGLDDARCAEIGLRVVKLGMTWPVDRDFLREACAGSREILVVEEKRPVIEDQLAGALYAMASDRPAITGKRDDRDRVLLPSDGVLDGTMIRRALTQRLEAHAMLDDAMRQRVATLEAIEGRAVSPVVALRGAFFCSGCPHNTSTRVPDGSAALGATGCHGLAVTMPDRNTMTFVGMGAEGTPWIGAQHFTDTKHMFANMGDGTYTHSGLLAIRAALSAKANVTFKLLYNDAVAMTGGQPLEGGITVPQIVKELRAEGVDPVVLVSDEPEKFAGENLGVRVAHRDYLEDIQEELREGKGVSAIVYEQTCANEKRRRRKRGTYPDPDLRLFINQDVCEGCGDCSVQSNCVSVTPIETEFGRKRAIDQSTCNKDYSCVKGFCPSFVSVRGGKLAKKALDMGALKPWSDKLPEPAVVDISDSYSMLVTGIGGTGVLTVGAILGMAAHMEGKAAKILDMTGMAQKGGGVQSHVRFSDNAANIPAMRLGTGQTDLLIACDLIVASGPDVAKTIRPETRVIANEDVIPTGEFQSKQDLEFGAGRFLPSLEKRVNDGNIALLRANELAGKLMGDTIFTNLMIVGFAAQKGLMPVTLESIAEAVRLNGTAVDANLKALTLGRIAAEFPEELLAFAGLGEAGSPFPKTLEALIASRRERLTAWQDAAWADRYEQFVRDIAGRIDARVSNPEPFLMAVANQLARLMAYKDEYEVARMYADPAFERRLREQFDGDYKIGVNLGSPLISWKKDPKTGRPKKVELPGWLVLPMFRMMAKMKGLRGGPFDLFGLQGERKMERALIGEYRALIEKLAERIDDANSDVAEEIAASAALIRGYGPVKEAGVARFRAELPALFEALDRARRSEAAKRPALAG
ncbi:indolepyruvate ferredoxin oxidoreductase family protein [Stakelama tenebrarum]|uniref:Indolepyruvate ferredoxin oxidoreductase family protein n=1 Tax=Stakelama tenebrarum TaxID=2711215 RepID=A0A6G6Y741_9SPHN|nr:indolepyruvate ferredoxin oxidoreductase family protein [Sphingosinithalassobacter tenebrarum]QIG80764.1 indolepyruvate ferredoxin oxidoreductase family protein [Sphingosinithalassobacter tenebrarum]